MSFVPRYMNFVNDFLKRVKLTGSREFYFVFTSGGYSGIASRLARIYCRHRGLTYKGSADIIMPRNYIASDAYPMQDAETVKARIAAAKEKIAETAEIIKSAGRLKSRHVWLFEYLIILPVTQRIFILWIPVLAVVNVQEFVLLIIFL